VHAELRRLDQRCSRKRVRLMRAQGLVGVHARRRWRRGRPDVAPAPDLVKPDFTPSGPDQVWAADVTQFRTMRAGCISRLVIDLWSRRVVGWSMRKPRTASWSPTRC
jgi:transposase InsO family protein